MAPIFTIGFSSLSEAMPSVAFRTDTLRAAAGQHPDLRLVVRDNDLNDEKALANAREFAEIPVDVAIIFHINERLGPELGSILMKKRIPVIAVDIPIPMAIYFGVDNKEAGKLAGQELGKWVAAHWDGQVDKLLVMTEQRVVSVIQDRINSALESFVSFVNVSKKDILYVDSGHTRQIAAERAVPVLERWKDFRRIAVIGVNDDAALGVLDAARYLDREEHLAIIGQDAQDAAREEICRSESRFIASTDVHLEEYGPGLIDLSLRILSGERVPPFNYTRLSCFTAQAQC